VIFRLRRRATLGNLLLPMLFGLLRREPLSLLGRFGNCSLRVFRLVFLTIDFPIVRQRSYLTQFGGSPSQTWMRWLWAVGYGSLLVLVRKNLRNLWRKEC